MAVSEAPRKDELQYKDELRMHAKEDGAFYAAAPQAGEAHRLNAGWGMIFSEDHEQLVMQEDMSEKTMLVNEAKCLKALVDTGKCLPEGLWFGGEKFKVVQKDLAVEEGDQTIGWIFASRPKQGVHIILTTAQILVVFFDESKGLTLG
ncbi:unnamed protein product, partial [Polarella glacialis]